VALIVNTQPASTRTRIERMLPQASTTKTGARSGGGNGVAVGGGRGSTGPGAAGAPRPRRGGRGERGGRGGAAGGTAGEGAGGAAGGTGTGTASAARRACTAAALEGARSSPSWRARHASAKSVRVSRRARSAVSPGGRAKRPAPPDMDSCHEEISERAKSDQDVREPRTVEYVAAPPGAWAATRRAVTKAW